MFVEKEKNGILFMQSTNINAFHAFSTRYGGVSIGEFKTMNFGSTRGDSHEAVAENWRRWCGLFGTAENMCCVTKQVHGNFVRTVTSADIHRPFESVPYEADGIVTGEKGLPIFCFTADCVPVLLHDAEGHAAGAVHCGWRSSVSDILSNAVSEMEALGAEKNNIHVALGPAIGRCCFETDRDVPDAIKNYLSGDTEGIWKEKEDGKYLVDLRSANARRLLQLGIPKENIDISGECTVCLHERYWSARYCGRYNLMRGSLSAGIVLN